MKKVENKKEQILPSEEVFNDKDILQDTLVSLKHLGTMYGTFISEASNKKLISSIEPHSKDITTRARECFNLMFEKGWYCLTEESSTTIDDAYNKYSGYLEHLK